MSKSSTTSQSQSMDPDFKAASLDLLNRGRAVADQPYTPYGGQTVAGFSPTQTQGYTAAKTFATGDVGAENLQAAQGAATRALGFSPANIETYLNPYTQNVIDTTMSDLERQRQIAQQGTGDRAIAARAFGGDRFGLSEAETNRAAFDTMAKTAAQLRSQGYDTATQTAMGVANLGLTAGDRLAALSDQERQQALQNASTLETVGAAEQAQTQRELDDLYRRFQEEQQYPAAQTNYLANIFKAAPASGGVTTQTTTPSTMSQIGQGISSGAALRYLLG
jgi:hypothetical protein